MHTRFEPRNNSKSHFDVALRFTFPLDQILSSVHTLVSVIFHARKFLSFISAGKLRNSGRRHRPTQTALHRTREACWASSSLSMDLRSWFCRSFSGWRLYIIRSHTGLNTGNMKSLWVLEGEDSFWTWQIPHLYISTRHSVTPEHSKFIFTQDS